MLTLLVAFVLAYGRARAFWWVLFWLITVLQLAVYLLPFVLAYLNGALGIHH